MCMETYISKKERKEEEKEKRKKSKMFKSASVFIVTALVVAGGIAWMWRYAGRIPQAAQGDIISKNGLHWHAKIALFIEDKAQEIPENIGIGITHNPIHTHDATGEIHLEFSGLVKKNDLALGKFFDAWGKKFSSSCLLDSCIKENKTIQMTVNGKENTEFENYIMQDKDVIEIKYK